MGGGSGVNTVDDFGCQIYCGVESERKVSAVDIVVDGFGQTDDI